MPEAEELQAPSDEYRSVMRQVEPSPPSQDEQASFTFVDVFLRSLHPDTLPHWGLSQTRDTDSYWKNWGLLGTTVSG